MRPLTEMASRWEWVRAKALPDAVPLDALPLDALARGLTGGGLTGLRADGSWIRSAAVPGPSEGNGWMAMEGGLEAVGRARAWVAGPRVEGRDPSCWTWRRSEWFWIVAWML